MFSVFSDIFMFGFAQGHLSPIPSLRSGAF